MRGDQYAVALGLLDGGQVVLGVLGCPNLPMASIANSMQPAVASGEAVGCLFAARLGAGTWVEALEGGGVPKQVGCGMWDVGMGVVYLSGRKMEIQSMEVYCRVGIGQSVEQ